MAYTKRTWLGRQGTGLNKFSIGGASPVTIVNQPDSVTQVGDALSAGNLNDLEDRIESAFNDVDTALGSKADESEVTNLNNAISQHEARIENLEQKAGDYVEVNYRGTNAVPTGKAKNALVESIVGKTRAWNSLGKNTLAQGSQTIGDVTWTVNADGSVTATWSGTNSANSTLAIIGSGSTWGASIPSGHQVLIGYKTDTSNSQIRYGFYDDNATAIVDTGTTDQALIYTMGQIGGANVVATKQYMAYRILAGASASTVTFYPLLRDLTLMFPEGVPSTVAECVAICPDILKYDSYGYSLVSTVVSGVRASVPYDAWDGVMEEGYINVANGQNASGAAYRRSAMYVPVTPNTKYRMRFPSTGGVLLFYGSDKSYLGYDGGILLNTVTSAEFTTGANVYYIRFWFNYVVGFGSVYVSDYATLSLSSSVTLRSAGSVSEVLDVETGYKTRPVGVASNLGSYTWIRRSDGLLYTSTAVLADALSATNNISCAKYLPPTTSHSGTGTEEGHISVDSGGYIYCMDNSFTTADAFKTAMANVALYYELATPDTDQSVCVPIINNTLPTESGGTIETIQTQTPVIDNSLDVGYLAL